MNAIKGFFQVDIPATFSAGKWRIELLQLNSQLSSIEKQKEPILREIGMKAWENRVRDPLYEKTFTRLEELNASSGLIQQDIDSNQNVLALETKSLDKMTTDYNAQNKEQQGLRQQQMQALGELQGKQKIVENRLQHIQAAISQAMANVRNMEIQGSQIQASAMADKEVRMASLQSTITTTKEQIASATSQLEASRNELTSVNSAQMPIKEKIAECDRQIKQQFEQFRTIAAPVQKRISDLQLGLTSQREKKNQLTQNLQNLLPGLGKEVEKARPVSPALSASFGKIDAANGELKAVNDKINLTQARLASVGKNSMIKVGIAAGVLVLLLGCFIAGIILLPNIINALQPDPKASIHLVQSWDLEDCSVSSYNGSSVYIAVWENRQKKSTATVKIDTKLIGSNDVTLDTQTDPFQIGPGGSILQFGNLDPNGSRIQEVKRSVRTASFREFGNGRSPKLDVKTSFEDSRYSSNISLVLDITNQSDFGITSSGTPYALVIDSKNEIIDILEGSLDSSTISVDSDTTVTFQSIGNYILDKSCLDSNYSNQTVTFWYFVPFQIRSTSSDQISLSGKAKYTP